MLQKALRLAALFHMSYHATERIYPPHTLLSLTSVSHLQCKEFRDDHALVILSHCLLYGAVVLVLLPTMNCVAKAVRAHQVTPSAFPSTLARGKFSMPIAVHTPVLSRLLVLQTGFPCAGNQFRQRLWRRALRQTGQNS
ncbi:hypothetical protein TRVL_10256 [Trypanosoma vivax]|nr:hypothetical protein TRVL_10256 [Trypanosoma vivax]